MSEVSGGKIVEKRKRERDENSCEGERRKLHLSLPLCLSVTCNVMKLKEKREEKVFPELPQHIN